jgi:ribosomal protein S18 acetylase RimI-like enzyme
MLAPMNPAEFASFAEEAVASYAHDNMISGRASQADAQRLARQSFGRLLPDGLNTPGHHLFTIRADSAGSAGSVVGSLWFAVVDGVEGRTGYIYNIRIEPPNSGRGQAKEALDLVEAVALQLGLDAIALHVFGFNTNAQALYRSQGYGITGMNMRKALRPGSSAS